jgi:hypothetical protein
MFMRYTHLGVGHSAMLRRITRDCLGPELATHTNAMDVVDASNEDMDHEEAGDGEGYDECDSDNEDKDGDEEGYEESDDELGDEDDEFEDFSF